MLIEYIRYEIPAPQHAEFLAAYAAAARELDATPHCQRHEISQGLEEPDHFVVRLEWDSLEGHEQGFRNGPHFPPFFALVRPYFGAIREMKHYEVRLAG